MAIILGGGQEVRFGQDLKEIEQFVSRRAIEKPTRITRPDIDRFLDLETFQMRFDTGRLCHMTFGAQFEFVSPLDPYPEDWKNFPAMGGRKIYMKMPHEEYLAYVAAWEERAVSLGAEKVEAGNELTATQFSVAEIRDNDWHYGCVNLGSRRRTSGGGLWFDGWGATFELGSETPVLLKLSAFRDEFNTRARGLERGRETSPR
jgi:hypothetical protein